jgi:hypothetical protein
VPEWRKKDITGSVLLVDRTKKDLDVKRVKAVVEQISRNLAALQNNGIGWENRKKVLDAMMPEELVEYY